jgi:hypothetical protein
MVVIYRIYRDLQRFTSEGLLKIGWFAQAKDLENALSIRVTTRAT